MGEIREGQTARLIFTAEGNSQRELDCFIQSIHKDRLSLKFPTEALNFSDYLGEGEEVLVKIFTPTGVKIYDAMILHSPLEPEFIIEYVENHAQVQRREYLRMDFETKVIIEREGKDNIITQTLDIGGGGIRFVYEGDFEDKEEVSCYLYLPLLPNAVRAVGQIVKAPYLKSSEHIVQFTHILERERDKIIKQCFDIEAAYYRD